MVEFNLFYWKKFSFIVLEAARENRKGRNKLFGLYVVGIDPHIIESR
jgi:hypothetical protein